MDFVGFNAKTIAMQCANSAFVSILFYLSIVYGFLADIFVFGEPISFYDLSGAGIIILTTVALALVDMKSRQTSDFKSI